MNEHLRDRVLRKLETLSDERAYQVLDYVEFLESKYAERQPATGSIFARFSEAVEDRLRAGKISASTIAETMGLMNRAMSVLNGVATGVAAASRSVASDIERAGTPRPGTTGPGASAPADGAPVAGRGAGGPGAGAPPAPPPPEGAVTTPDTAPETTGSGELEPPADR